METIIDVFIIGARGYTKKYGGWETLVHGLVDNQINDAIKYHVFEIVDNRDKEENIEIDNIECLKIYEKSRGGFTMIFADMKAFKMVKKIVKSRKIKRSIILYLGARVGIYQFFAKHSLSKNGIIVMENPAGLEWKRPKWGFVGSIYQYISCYFTAISSDYIICDCLEMKRVYDKMLKTKKHPRLFVAYGAYPETELKNEMPQEVNRFFNLHNIIPNNYYLIINRFMPENSWELILREYMKSKTNKDFIIVSNIDKEYKYYNRLKKKLKFDNDKRIKFVGTTYNPVVLSYLRHFAFGYFNGHTVGGTNPGLLEAMSTTGLVLARDCPFSREVCGDFALFFDESEENSLSKMICIRESMPEENVKSLIASAKERMKEKQEHKKTGSWNDERK